MRKTIITRSFARKLPRPADCMSVSCCLAKWLTKWATGAQLSQSFSVIKSQMSSPWSSSWSILCEILRYWDIRIRYCEIRYCWESVEILAQSFPVSMVVWFMSGSCLVSSYVVWEIHHSSELRHWVSCSSTNRCKTLIFTSETRNSSDLCNFNVWHFLVIEVMKNDESLKVRNQFGSQLQMWHKTMQTYIVHKRSQRNMLTLTVFLSCFFCVLTLHGLHGDCISFAGWSTCRRRGRSARSSCC